MSQKQLYMAICDDEPNDIEQIQKAIQRALDKIEYHEEYGFQSFTKGSELREAVIKEQFSLVFLDVEMPEMDGFELASKLYMDMPGIHLIFVSNHEHFVFDAYEYAPFWFVRKSSLEQDMYRALERYIQLTSGLRITYKVKDKKGYKEVNIKDILCVESTKHTLTFRTVQGLNLKKYGSLKIVENELESYGFLRIHKSCLVNQRHVQRVEKQDVLLSGDIRVAMGRDRRKDVCEAMIRYEKERQGYDSGRLSD